MRTTLHFALLIALLACVACASAAEKKADTPPPVLVPTEVMVIEHPLAQSKKKGSSSSIGSDAYDLRTQTAWFYGEKPIVTCFNSIESFGHNEKNLTQLLGASLKRWRTYFAAKRITKGNKANAPDVNFKLVGKCKGNEDLSIFFGTGPIFGGLDDLKAVQKLSFPLAYVNKTHMSPDMLWAKGYIRVINNGYYASGVEGQPAFPDWSRAGNLEAVLTHELGHVLGFSHTEGTVMRSNLVDEVLAREDAPPSSEIDVARQLVTCLECDSGFRLTASSVPLPFFTQFGLRTDRGLRVIRSANGFRLADGAHELRVTETSRAGLERPRTLWSNFPDDIQDSSETFALYGYGLARGDKNRKVPMVLEYNLPNNGGALVLRSIIDGEFVEVGRFNRE